MIDGEMREKNLRFFSRISPSIMYNKIYPFGEKPGVIHNACKK